MNSPRLFGAALALLVGLSLTPAAMADDTTVTITDSGFTPTTLSVAPNTTITFINKGNQVHSATDTGKNPVFDTGGIGPGQTGTVFIQQPGTYSYASQPDCLNGNVNPTFVCGPYTLVIGAPAAAAGTVVPTPTATPAPNSTIQQNATVQISDTGFSPANVAIVPGGTITWTNVGTNIHTATSGSAPLPFDSGGLSPGQTNSVQLNTPVTYVYTSSTDCQPGNVNPAFNCAANYTVTVQAAAVGSTTTNPGVPFSGPTVLIRDDGFQPQTTNATAGQTITWLNISTVSHTVASAPGSPATYDSGGLSDGDSFSFVFTQPGTYTFYSTTDQPAG